MSRAKRVTLFVHMADDGAGRVPDLILWRDLLQQQPLISTNDDGTRVLVFDLDGQVESNGGTAAAQRLSMEALRHCSLALAETARSLGLPLTAAMAESAEEVARAELISQARMPGRRLS